MATNEDIQGWERIAALITQEADLADLRAELIEKGIPVDERVEALRTLVRRKFQRAVREQTAREIEQSIAATEAQAKEIGSWSLADVLKWLEKAKGGVFGSEVAELTLAYYRNKQQEQLTEAETRSLVADIMAAKK